MKPAPIFFLLFGLLTACQAVQPAAQPFLPTATASPAPRAALLSPESALAVAQTLGWSLGRSTVRQNAGVPYAAFPAASSGEIETVILPDGTPLDTLALLLPTRGGVVRLNAPLGFAQDGRYLYFFTGLEAPELDRQQVLADARSRFPAGRVLELTIFKYVSLQGVDWQACVEQERDARFLAGCRLALAYHPHFPEVERFFLSKTVLDPNWVPVGWWLSAYPDDLTIPLP